MALTHCVVVFNCIAPESHKFGVMNFWKLLKKKRNMSPSCKTELFIDKYNEIDSELQGKSKKGIR